MLFRACLFFFVVAAIALADYSTDRPPTENEIKIVENSVQILRYTLKLVEAEYEKNMNQTVPISNYEVSNKFAHNLASVVYTQAARTNGVILPGDKLKNGMEFIDIAKALNDETD